MTKPLLFVLGAGLGVLVMIGVFETVVVPSYDRSLTSVHGKLESVAADYATLLETTQSIIDTTNTCVKLLWTMPLEDIETVRKQEMPTLLPRVIEQTIDNTPHPVYL
jgi:hypothetical protein